MPSRVDAALDQPLQQRADEGIAGRGGVDDA